ncbi:MAG: hypothetical protein EDM79_05065, partial [Chloroflexi bacterium]
PHAASAMLAITSRDSKASKRLFIFLLLQNLSKFDSRKCGGQRTGRPDVGESASPPFTVWIYKESLKTLAIGSLWLAC